MKKKAVWLWVLAAAAVGVITLWPFYRPLVRLEFAEGDSVHLNPARGFYFPVKSHRPQRLSQVRENGCSLVFVMFDIGDFNGSDLSKQKIEELDTIFQEAKNRGLKVIFRASYGFENASAYNDPEDIAQIIRHIGQIKPILQKYGDILYVIQAGFLGAYGEWHSSNFGDPPAVDAQAAVLHALLDGLPENVLVCVRRPSFIRALFAQGKLDPAYADRIGVHNDALLGSGDDWGTYTDLSREEELAWAQTYFMQLPYGGETCCISDYSDAENAIREFPMLHLSYLNSQYNEDVLRSWKNAGAGGRDGYAVIRRHMGYHFSLQAAELSGRLAAGGASPGRPAYQQYGVRFFVRQVQHKPCSKRAGGPGADPP